MEPQAGYPAAALQEASTAEQTSCAVAAGPFLALPDEVPGPTARSPGAKKFSGACCGVVGLDRTVFQPFVLVSAQPVGWAIGVGRLLRVHAAQEAEGRPDFGEGPAMQMIQLPAGQQKAETPMLVSPGWCLDFVPATGLASEPMLLGEVAAGLMPRLVECFHHWVGQPEEIGDEHWALEVGDRGLEGESPVLESECWVLSVEHRRVEGTRQVPEVERRAAGSKHQVLEAEHRALGVEHLALDAGRRARAVQIAREAAVGCQDRWDESSPLKDLTKLAARNLPGGTREGGDLVESCTPRPPNLLQEWHSPKKLRRSQGFRPGRD